MRYTAEIEVDGTINAYKLLYLFFFVMHCGGLQ